MASLLFLPLLMPAVIGLVVGSFLGMLVSRLPRGEPIVLARSACPFCGHRLEPVELIPLLSWIVQRRRCRACGRRLSAFYPVIEAACALVAVAAALWTSGTALIAACLLGWCIVALAAWLWSRAHAAVRL